MSQTGSIGIDIGGTKTLLALLDPAFRVVHEVKFKTRDHRTIRSFTANLLDCLNVLLKYSKEAGLKVEGLGVGCSGFLTSSGTVRNSPNIPFLKGFSFPAVFAPQLKARMVFVNDVLAGLYGEHQLGAAMGRKHVIGIFLGTGVGGGLIIDGKLYRGARGNAGDIGQHLLHSLVLDDVVSRTAIAAEAAALAAKNLAPYLLKSVGTDVNNISSGSLAKSIANGDHLVEKLVRSRCQILGAALSNVVNFLNPEMVILGGGLADAIPNIVRTEVKAGMREHVTPEAQKGLKVVTSKLKSHSVTVGAAKLAVTQLPVRKAA